MAHCTLHVKMADGHLWQALVGKLRLYLSTLDQRKIIGENVAHKHRLHAEESFNAFPQLYPGPKECSIRDPLEHVMSMALSIGMEQFMAGKL